MRWELDWLENRVRISPHAIAVVDGETGEQWTYLAVNERAKALAFKLLSNGVEKGDRIALLSPNHICYFDLLFACGKIGAIFVPLNWRLSQAEITYILQDCTPKLLAMHSSLINLIENNLFDHTIIINSNEYIKIVESENKEHSKEVMIEDKDPLSIIYTGGTTGKPKGVVLTHQSMMWNGINTVISWNLTGNDVTLTYLPMFHTGGLNALSIPILMIGGKVVIARDFRPTRAIELINKERCTIILMVPTMYHMIVGSDEFIDEEFPTMHTFLSGGAPCPLEIYQAFEKKGLSFKEGYGLTEAGPNNFFINPEETLFRRGSVGKAMLFNQIKLIKDDGSEAGFDEVGEILIRGKHMFTHYWNNAKATNEVLVDGWLHTGDLARQDRDGYHYIVGRKKEMIITGGENVYPLEVEHCIGEHSAVNEVAIVGLPDPKWGEMVAAFVSLKKNRSLTKEELTEHCLQTLGKYKVPRVIVFVEQLPKTHVGKIDKKGLQKQYEHIVS